jgi:hypothetical protein
MCVLNYLVAELGDSNEEFKLVENDLTRINVLCKRSWVFYALIYMKFKVNNMNVNVMLDSSATHTFVSNRLVGELGLQLSSSHITIKTMNVNA